MKITPDTWYWYKHRTWGWMEVKALVMVEPGVWQCFSPPTMVYLINQGELKLTKGSGRIYPWTPNIAGSAGLARALRALRRSSHG